MNEAVFMVLISILTAAIGKLWLEVRAIDKKHADFVTESGARETACLVKLATMAGQVSGLEQSVSYLKELGSMNTKEAASKLETATLSAAEQLATATKTAARLLASQTAAAAVVVVAATEKAAADAAAEKAPSKVMPSKS